MLTMIPIHDLIDKADATLKIVRLDALTQYDTTRPHRHNYFELFIFEKGDGVHEIDFQVFPIESNSVHIVAPEQVHQVRRELNTNGYVILFDPSVVATGTLVSDFLFDHLSLDATEFKPTYQFDSETSQQILRAAKAMFDEREQGSGLRNEFMINHLNLICIACMRTLQDRSASRTKNGELYTLFRRLLRSNFKEIKKVREYAAALNISEKKLNEVVNSKTGLSCSALIYKQIILEAKRLLRANISAKEVAYALRFEDPAHFSKFFKAQTGIRPSEFQKIHA